MHLTSQQLELLAARQLEVQELLTVTRHIDDCDICRRRISPTITERVQALQSSLSDEHKHDHLSHEELAGYVDDALTHDNRVTAGQHLRDCVSCSTVVADLTELRDSLDQEMPTIAVRKSHRASTISPTSRGTYRSRRFAAGLAGASMLALAVIALVWRSSNSTGTGQTSPPSAARESARSDSSSDVKTPPPVLVQLRDRAGNVTFDAQGNISGLGVLTPLESTLVTQALRDQTLPRSPALNALKSHPSRLMGSREESVRFALLSPLATSIQKDRPVFRWQPLESATSYTVTILDTKFNVLVTSEPVEGTVWTATSALPRGEVYLWQVRARMSSGELITAPSTPAPEARFKVLDRVQIEALRRAEETHRKSHLVMGLLYTEAGAMDDAEVEFRALLKANPQSVVAVKLHERLKSLRR